jgi:hypothetical protein
VTETFLVTVAYADLDASDMHDALEPYLDEWDAESISIKPVPDAPLGLEERVAALEVAMKRMGKRW